MDATATDVSAPTAASDLQVGAASRAKGRRIRWSADASAAAVFVALALMVTARLWLSGGSSTTADNTGDHAQFLFFFEHAASAVTNLHHPLFTTLMGAPYGVNLMANTSFLGMAVPLIPVTLLAGPGVSFALAVTIGLAGTAAAWYVVLRRHVTSSRAAAFVAAALAGFGPGIVGHANGHPNLTAQFLLPLIVSAVIRLRTATRPVRSGLLLGLMITYQLFLNEELLLFTAMACGVMTVAYVGSRPTRARAEARAFLIGLGTAAAVSVVLAAYPLWFQFFGPQHYRGPFVWAPGFVTDVAEYPYYGARSVPGLLGLSSPLNSDPAETNAFLGLPLCIVALVAGVALWRVLAARIAAIVGATFGLLSLGETIQVGGVDTIPGPWRLLGWLPLLDSVIKPRLALVVTPAIGVLIAIVIDRLLVDRERTLPMDARVRRWIGLGAVAAALVPLVPTPVRAGEPEAVPAFIADGTWREYVDDGTVLPVAHTSTETPINWVLASGLRLHVVTGYFLGPSSDEDPTARYGPPERATGLLFAAVAASGDVPEITDDLRATVLADLRAWQVDVLVLPPHRNANALRQTVTELLGRAGEDHDGTWVWDVRDVVG